MAPVMSVRSELPIASVRDGSAGDAARAGRGGERGLVDRPVRLAGIEHLAALLAVEIGDRSRAIEQRVAALHDEIGIGAHHEELAPAHRLDHGAVVVGRLGLVVEQAGADDVIGDIDGGKAQAEPREDREIALRADMEDGAAARRDLGARHVARGGDAVIGVGGNAQLVELPRHPFRRPRRIGDENDGAAVAAKPRQRVARVGEGGDAVMHHAPDVAQHDVVARREGAEVFGELEGGRSLVRTRGQGLWSEGEIARECYSDCIAPGKGHPCSVMPGDRGNPVTPCAVDRGKARPQRVRRLLSPGRAGR